MNRLKINFLQLADNQTINRVNLENQQSKSILKIFNQALLTTMICSALSIGVSGCHSSADSYYTNTDNDNIKPDPASQPEPNKKAEYTDGFKLLAYNVYFMNKFISDWSADQRAKFILDSDAIKDHDVIILNELFDANSSKILLEGLKVDYPNQTPILAREYDEYEIDGGTAGTNPHWNERLGNTSKAGVSGGVAIVSRWPIKEQVEYVYKDGCGTDNLSKKGFVYVRLDKNGANYHVIGTHAQSEDSSCDSGQPELIRANQFREMQQFITAKNISVDEVLFIGGDFNVIKDSAEYPKALEILNVKAPDAYAGFDTSWDPESNALASYNYPEGMKEYLDYVFISKNHAQPTYWHNQSLDEISPRWENNGHSYEELSDHYPIAAFAYASKNTRTKSYRFINKPYKEVQFVNEQNRYIAINSNGKNLEAAKLQVNGADNTANVNFNIDNWYPNGQAYCIKNNDKVRVRDTQNDIKISGFWNINPTDSKFYANSEAALENLQIQIISDDGDCLKNDDKITFVKLDTESSTKTYLQQDVTNDNELSFTATNVNEATTFTIKMQAGKLHDWSKKLKYQP